MVVANDEHLNPYKSDAALFETKQTIENSNLSITVTLAGCSVVVSDRLKIFIVTIDNMLD